MAEYVRGRAKEKKPMHKVNLDTLNQTIDQGRTDPQALRQPVNLTGSWQVEQLAYCFWGGLACYAATFAIEAARDGVELQALRGSVGTDVDQSRALGLSDRPPVEQITWELEAEADVPPERLEHLKVKADEQCPGVYCIRNPIALETRLVPVTAARR